MLGTRRSTGKSRASVQVSFGSERVRSSVVQTHQVAAQRVNHAVDGLVRHGLALVCPTPQDDRLAPLHQLVEELLDQGDLPMPARPLTRTVTAWPFARGIEGRVEGLQVALATDEPTLRTEPARRAERRERIRGRRRATEARQNVRLRWAASPARGRSSALHRASRSGGTPSTQSLGGSGSTRVLQREHFDAGPDEGRRPTRPRRASLRRCTSRTAGARLVERLLRRHVVRGADILVLLTKLVVGDPRRLRCTPKSRSTTRPSGVTSTLDGLMSRCSLSSGVKRDAPFDELAQRGS